MTKTLPVRSYVSLHAITFSFRRGVPSFPLLVWRAVRSSIIALSFTIHSLAYTKLRVVMKSFCSLLLSWDVYFWPGWLQAASGFHIVWYLFLVEAKHDISGTKTAKLICAKVLYNKRLEIMWYSLQFRHLFSVHDFSCGLSSTQFTLVYRILIRLVTLFCSPQSFSINAATKRSTWSVHL